MKFSILKKDLAFYLNLLTPIVDKSDLRPAAANLKIEITKDYIKLETLNLTSALEAKIKVDEKIKVENEGSVTVSANKLSMLAKNIDDETEIKFELEENWINIYAEKSKFKLFTLSIDSFPSFEIAEKNSEINIDREKFKNLLNLTSFAIANIKKATREFMKGVLLEFDDKKLNGVATDGHRLAFAKIDLDEKFEKIDETKFIVPERSVQDIIKLLNIIEDEKIELNFEKNQIKMKSAEFEYKSKLILADYAAYKEIIPKNNPHKLSIDIEELKSSLKKVSFLANEHKEIVNFFIEKNKVVLKAENRENEIAEDSLQAEFSSQDPYKISFNFNYIIDVLNKATEEEKKIDFYLNTIEERSVLIKKENDENFFYIVMPTKN